MEEFRQLPRSEAKPPILLLSKHAGHFSLYFESGKLFFLLLIRIALTNNLPRPLRAGKYRHVSNEASSIQQLLLTTPSLKIKPSESHLRALPVDDRPGLD